MTIAQQKRFIRELIHNVQADILEHVSDMPSNWDGIELRQYIADKFARETFSMEGARRRNYDNAVATTAAL